MVQFDSIKSGDVLYDCHRRKCGSTTLSELGVWKVVVRSVDHTNMNAVVSRNGNQEKVYEAACFRSLRRFPPEWVRPCIGEAKCHMCGRTRAAGHSERCQHPKAIAVRKRLAK